MVFNPNAVGASMFVSGRNQIETGREFKVVGAQLQAFSDMLGPRQPIRTSLVSIGTGVRSIARLLNMAAAAMKFIENKLNAISIPTITPVFSGINIPGFGQVRFMIGLARGDVWPFAGIAAYMENIRVDIMNIRAALLTIADDMHALRRDLPKIRTSLATTADAMKSSGTGMIKSGRATQKAGRQLRR